MRSLAVAVVGKFGEHALEVALSITMIWSRHSVRTVRTSRSPMGGSPDIQRATVYNVATFFGWVTTAAEVVPTSSTTPTLRRERGSEI